MNRTDREAFKAAHDLGLNRHELADRFNITPGSVTRIKKELGLPLAPRGTVDRDELANLVEDGWTLRQLADRYDVNERTISRIKAELGLAHEYLGRPLTQERLTRIKAMIEDGWSHAEIHRTEGIELKTLRKHFPGTAWTKQQHAEYMAINLAENPRFNRRPRTYNPAKYQDAA